MHPKAGILSPNTTTWHDCQEINACKINKSILNYLGRNGIIPQIQKAVFKISSFTVHLTHWLYCIFSTEYLLKIFLLLWIHCRYISKLTAKNNNSLSIYTFLDSLNWHYYYYFTCKAAEVESTYVTCTCPEPPDSCFSWYPFLPERGFDMLPTICSSWVTTNSPGLGNYRELFCLKRCCLKPFNLLFRVLLPSEEQSGKLDIKKQVG